MRKLMNSWFFIAPVLGFGVYIACITQACSQDKKPETSTPKVVKSVPKKETHQHSDHDSTPPVKKTETNPPEPTPVQETTDLEPAPDAPPPQAKITAPVSVSVKSHVILDFSGTVSTTEPDFDVVFCPEESKATITKLYNKDKTLAYGLLIPDKAGKYRIALVAFSPSKQTLDTIRSYAFTDIDVTDTSKPPEPAPQPTPGPLPEPPGPLPTPTPSPPKPAQTDTYGMYAYTQDLLSKMPAEDPWQPRIPLIYDCFDKMIAQSSGFTDATKFVQATSDCYKSALGKDYNYFSHYFFTPLKTHLGKINSDGKLPSTVEAHVVAWKEISKALHEVKIPASSRSHK